MYVIKPTCRSYCPQKLTLGFNENIAEIMIASKNASTLISNPGAIKETIISFLLLNRLTVNKIINTDIYKLPVIIITELFRRSLALLKYPEIARGVIIIRNINNKKRIRDLFKFSIA